MTINFGIVTPTFNRRTLLRRHLRRTSQQTYRRWRLLVVHDGPNPAIRSLVDSFCKHDSRISFLETDAAANDSGVTPRLEGVNHLIGENPVPDYVVFWDDDNAYAIDALGRIADALETSGQPDLLLVSVRYGANTIPPPDVPIRSLTVGKVDTASLVFRPTLARDAYASVRRLGEIAREDVLRFNDFLAYQYVSQLVPAQSIKRDAGVLVCRHDGLRWGPSIRLALGLPPVSLARLFGLGR